MVGLWHCEALCPALPMEDGGREAGMLLQFCCYHIQNYHSYKQGEQVNLRTTRDSSGGNRKRQEPPGEEEQGCTRDCSSRRWSPVAGTAI